LSDDKKAGEQDGQEGVRQFDHGDTLRARTQPQAR
jgi:hypothetical protein